MLALFWGNELIGEEMEPWFMMVSGVLVLGIAAWMFWQQTRSRHGHHHHHDHHHDRAHGHSHGHHHHHDHAQGNIADLDNAHMDAHARAHAEEIRQRLASGGTGTWQTILFGLSGGLIPCPAAITVFILCLHLGKVALGVTLVSAFSIGLAATLVAAVGLRAVSARTSRFDRVMVAAPWRSAALIALIGLLILWSGYSQLGDGHVH